MNITVQIKRLSFALVAALLVAVAPASASADTGSITSDTPAPQTTAATDNPAAAASNQPAHQSAADNDADASAIQSIPDAAKNTAPAGTTSNDKDNAPGNNHSNSIPQTTTNSSEPATINVIDTTSSDIGSRDEKATGTAAKHAEATDATTAAGNNKASITNNTASVAKSGNATVADNTTAGDANTGSASVSSTTVSSLQSSSAFTGDGQVTTWSTDINGNHVGDILLNPSQFQNLPVSNSSAPATDLTVNNNTDTEITNNITLNAKSGSATVANNGTAGSGTTGSATAEANLINLVNSVIGANQTFVGTVNITGNLDGDILLPGTTLADLLKAQTAQSEASAGLHNDTATTITNNVKTTATSGDATVANNGTAGSATTGSAMTNVSIVNLTGQTVTAKNSMVVFVNVLGRWVGFIVDAPAGAANAVLGDGVISRSATGGNGTSKSTTTINNNVTVNAASGNALVANNGTAGNAVSGNTAATVNILNMSDDNLSLGGWFGILFINVLGSWTGSFGIDTAAGTVPAPPSGNSPAASNNPASTPETPTPAQSHVSPSQSGRSGPDGSISTNTSNGDSTHKDAVLSANTSNDGAAPSAPAATGHTPNFAIAAAGIGASLSLLIVERVLSRRASKRAAAKELAGIGASARL